MVWPQMAPASEWKIVSRPMNTTTTESTGALCSGRRTTRSIPTPSTKETSTTAGSAIQNGRFHSQQLPAHEGAEHGELALREIDVVGGDEDHHQRQRQAGVDGAVGEAGGDLLNELLHAVPVPQ